MTPFKSILAAAEKRAGGKNALARLLPEPKSAAAIVYVTESRYI
jgi:hypothetical protein